MSEPSTSPPDPSPPAPPTPSAADSAPGVESSGGSPGKRSFLRGLVDGVAQFGRDAISVTLGRIIGEGPESGPVEARGASMDAAVRERAAETKLGMLHQVTERLRGAADEYIAAKLDELEARVDAKLNQIETRIDKKVVEIHEQLKQLRDQELNHRLRLLKITLIFTVLVAVVSLGYKWFSRFLLQQG